MNIVHNHAAPVGDARVGKYVQGLGYIGLNVSDLASWTGFARDVLGLEVIAGRSPDMLFLKLDDQPFRFILTRGPADDIEFAGWQLADAAALADYAVYLTQQGVDFQWAEPDDLALRGIQNMLRVRDPNGVVHEMFHGMAQGTPFTPGATKGRFVTGPGGLGHIVFGSTDYARSVAFATMVLGARTSDIIEQALTPSVSAHVTFMHVNERHHSIAFANRAGGKKLHHFMIEIDRVDDVGRARDRHMRAGLAIAQDIGQHPNDQMISYYGATPSGVLVEFGWGGVKVDVPSWQEGHYDRMSEWGHRPIAGSFSPPQPKAKDVTVTAAGNWTLMITTPMGEMKSELTLAADLTGTIVAMDEATSLYEGALGGNALHFKTDVAKPFAMTLAFTLALDGDTAVGEVLAGPMGPSPVRGTRR